jgi:hypothetical protein
MTSLAHTSEKDARAIADGALNGAARFWLIAIIVGQGLFLFYILAFYFPSILTGNYETWNHKAMVMKAYVPGDTAGNFAFAVHVMMAAVVTFGGTFQLVPRIRAKAPAVHRWTGRAFLTTCIVASVMGLWMTWIRLDPTTELNNTLSISFDGVLIIGFAILAWRTAAKRDFAAHRRWAMRTFMVANGVWFLRVGISAYGMFHKLSGAGPSVGAVYEVWSWGCYLAPLLILELFMLAKAKGGPTSRMAMSGLLAVATLIMCVGILASWMGMFAPTLARLNAG